MDQLDDAMSDLDKDLKSYDDIFKQIRIEMSVKYDRSEAKKIWEQFQRFAEYTDLKDLYQKCIPELAKFEQKMMDHEVNY